MGNLTEMYSALSAEVQLENDPATLYNFELQEKLLPAANKDERLLVCGQALSHCVNYTVRDLVQQGKMAAMLGDPSRKQEADLILQKVHLLQDGSHSVMGFEAVGEAFVQEMKQLKVNVVEQMGDLTWGGAKA